MRAVVTGAAGFVGSHLCESLLEAGDEVVGIDSFSDSYDVSRKEANVAQALQWGTFRLVRADVKSDLSSTLLDKADVVYHLAGESATRPSWGGRFPTYVADDLLSTWRVIDAARGVPLWKFVHASCASVYGVGASRRTPEHAPLQPTSPNGVTKLAAEKLCDAYRWTWRVRTVSLRLFSVYGPRQRPDLALARLVTAATSGTPFLLYGDGLQTRDLVHVSDVVRSLRQAALSPRMGVANIGTGSSVSLRELMRLVAGILGPFEVVQLPEQPDTVRHCGADITTARAWFGYLPRISLVDGLMGLAAQPVR